MLFLPGKVGSCWLATAPRTASSALEQSVEAETLIVGGGIVGLTAALRLSQRGRQVVVLEARRVGGQVTGGSTAKVTTQHALIYTHLIDTKGPDLARCYAQANSHGARQIEDWMNEFGISCDFERKSAYAYASSEDRIDAIATEREAALSLGLEAEMLEQAPLPFETSATLHFPEQAQFNPSRYLVGLAGAVSALGGRIFEQSRAIEFDESRRWRVATDRGTVDADNIVVATNMTVKSPLGMANRTQPRSHVAMAFRLDDATAVDGMFLGIDEPTRSLRTGRDAQGSLLVALGPKFDTGHDGDVASRFVDLDNWVRDNLPGGPLLWRWCNEDFDTPDRVPYVGAPDPDDAPGFYVATGFNAWGITNGTAAGIMIADLIIGEASPWQELYDPARPCPDDFHRNGDSQSIIDDVDTLLPGEGGVLVRKELKLAVRRDDAGELHTISAECTHKGCTVTWNNADRTWDCPCHGSIFAADGEVLHGPAKKPLSPQCL